ncbi:MAG: molybdenum cofactor biosynthesis protein MoaE, partial [Alphaproteobacteria bacterium HGW-Alphaproteobacteria-2]
MQVRVQSEPFDAGAELNLFSAAQVGAGAVVSFSGIVRDLPGASLQAMEIEHYPGMTQKAIAAIADEAAGRWGLTGV